MILQSGQHQTLRLLQHGGSIIRWSNGIDPMHDDTIIRSSDKRRGRTRAGAVKKRRKIVENRTINTRYRLDSLLKSVRLRTARVKQTDRKMDGGARKLYCKRPIRAHVESSASLARAIYEKCPAGEGTINQNDHDASCPVRKQNKSEIRRAVS